MTRALVEHRRSRGETKKAELLRRDAVNDRARRCMILIEIVAATDASGATQTFFLSDGEFITSPSDTPANVAFIPRLENAGEIGLHIFSDGTTGGGTALEIGSIEITNNDGLYDAFRSFSFDGRPITIRSGPAGGRYPDDFPIVLTCTAEGVQPDWDAMTIRLRDKQFMFERPAGRTRYLGNNALPNGLEGTAEDLKDTFKPRLMGRVFNRQPYLVNTSKLTFQVNDGAVVSLGVYDRGVALTLGADYATSALLQAATLATGEGKFSTCLAEGYFRLHDAPAGEVRFDAIEGASAPDRTAAQILRRLALGGGLSAAEISAADVEQLDAANSAVLGVYIEGDVTLREVMDRVAASVGGYYVFDPQGVLRMGVLRAPAGQPLITLYDYDLGEDVEVTSSNDTNVPIASATVLHTQIEAQTSDLAGSVSSDRRAFLALEYRRATSDPTTIKNQWLLADDLTIETLLTSDADAKAEANRLVGLHGVPRLRFDVLAPVDLITQAGVWMGREVALDLNRFGLAGGRSFVVIGMRFDLGVNQVVLSLWG